MVDNKTGPDGRVDYIDITPDYDALVKTFLGEFKLQVELLVDRGPTYHGPGYDPNLSTEDVAERMRSVLAPLNIAATAISTCNIPDEEDGLIDVDAASLRDMCKRTEALKAAIHEASQLAVDAVEADARR
jgi:hypothetical protein